jgi:hypothetical protein
MRKILDWNRSIISMLEVEAVPQSCIPEDQMGLSMIFQRDQNCWSSTSDAILGFREDGRWLLAEIVSCYSSTNQRQPPPPPHTHTLPIISNGFHFI